MFIVFICYVSDGLLVLLWIRLYSVIAEIGDNGRPAPPPAPIVRYNEGLLHKKSDENWIPAMQGRIILYPNVKEMVRVIYNKGWPDVDIVSNTLLCKSNIATTKLVYFCTAFVLRRPRIPPAN
jgi:hypothetical protein